MPNTPRGFPYPDPSDPAAAGADNIKALAEAVDSRLPKIAAGKQTVQMTDEAWKTGTITFPAGRFTAPPQVVVTAQVSWLVMTAYGITATSCTVGLRVYNGSKQTSAVGVSWIASETI